MPTSTVENYLKHLFLLQQGQPKGRLVSMGKLARTAQVTPGTATSMVKALSKAGLVTYAPRGGANLTDAGRSLALIVLRRHRLVELLLVKMLGLDWSEVHDEAEQLEHAISDRVLERIDTLLGHPTVDPHGDPIPTAEGELRGKKFNRLVDCQSNQRVRIARVLDQDPSFLQFADRYGLTPGIELTVESNDSAADAVTIQIGSIDAALSITLGSVASGKFLVEAVSFEASEK